MDDRYDEVHTIFYKNWRTRQMVIVAKFIGRDGSMGFRTGETYNIKTYMSDNMMYVKALGTHIKHIPYTQLESLLENWEILGDNVRGIK